MCNFINRIGVVGIQSALRVTCIEHVKIACTASVIWRQIKLRKCYLKRDLHESTTKGLINVRKTTFHN